ncbi:MAG: DNA (cytosine-5-)-methyltransferase [Spirochaetia bacterium]|nr:DNA (cytosine-5-)-methyltransferase [Spirochaetia bacterium]
MKKEKFRFIDLFAGIGGMRLAFEKAGGKCVYSCEWDKFASVTYKENFGDEPAGDIREVSSRGIPDFDILAAGFPCQPFSISGVSKKNALGRPHGFLDETQGTLFFEIARIIRDKKPRGFLLENVKNLVSHDRGRTFRIIEKTLTEELGYHISYRVINAKNVLPQHRERVFIAGFLDSEDLKNFSFPSFELKGQTRGISNDKNPSLSSILETKVDQRYHLTDKLWSYLQDYKEKHRLKGNGFGYSLADRNGIARTLSARYYKDGSEILIPVKGKNPRRLTPRECARLMGFPDSFKIPVSDTQAYKQFGNSVAVPIVSIIAKNIAAAIHKEPGQKKIEKGKTHRKKRAIA